MSRRTNDNFMKISRETLSDSFRLSKKAIVLWLWLNELEQRYTEEYGKRDWFMKTDSELAEIAGMSINTVKAAKKELKDHGFIEVSRGHWHYATTGKSSLKQPSVYRLLK